MSKRIMALVLSIVMIFSVCTSIAASENGGITLSVNSAETGEEFTVTVDFPAASTNLASYEFIVKFNATAVELVSIDKPTFENADSSATTVAKANETGSINVSYNSTTGENLIDTSAGISVVLTFKVKDTASAGTVDFTLSYFSACSVDDMTGEESEHVSADAVKNASLTIVFKCDHNWEAATCTTPKTCSICGATEGEADKTNHIGEATVENAKDATCTEKGYTGDKVCPTCGDTLETGTEIDALGHKGGTATCAAPAVCEVCEQPYGEVNPENHSWGEWTVETAATCGKDGREIRVCELCEKTEENVLPATGMHTDAEDDEDELCDVCGADLSCKHEGFETAIRDAKDPTCAEEGYTGDIYCTNCSKTVTPGTVISATGEHTGGEATCVAKAICEVCGNAYGEVNPENHKGETEVRDAVTGNCGEDGYTGDTYCLDCGAKIAEGTVIPADENHTGGEATCEKLAVCEVCGKEYGKLAAHKYEYTVTDATCTEKGVKTGTCSVCGDVTTEDLAELGHTWGEPVVVDATCTEAGSETYKCTVCETGEKIVELPALGHDFGEWIQTKAPTEDEEGEERRDCSRCDAYETRTLEALGTPFMDEWYWTMVMLHNQSYEIEADAEDGDISPNGVTKVKFAQSITYTITPDEGYEIEAVYVDGKNVGAVSEYTFKRVTKDHTIYAVCAEIEEEPAIGDEIVSTYVDVDVDDWFYDAVETVTAHGLMNGTGDGKFSPEVSTNRAMLVTILWRIEGEADAEPSAFTDVADDMWYTAAIDWAAANGIVNGYEDGTFGPEKAVTREQVMAILHRYAAYRGVTDDVAVSMIPQYDCSVWAENDVNWADMNGLLDNLGVDVTDMTAEASRAEIAAYLADFCVNVIQ